MTSTTFRRPSRRSPSFSSSSSSSSSSPSSPATPFRYSGIPFSWEQVPGIPKKNNTNKLGSSQRVLIPLPPSGNSFRKSFGKESGPMIRKYSNASGDRSFHEDPFFAAFVECSKDEGIRVTNTSKMRSNGGFYGSCLRACEVAESVVYMPRSRSGYFYR
ncbi:hypothetical protein QVD17_02239 [Tagetes erecta]|uniref:Uncharacterized protein n=1 Tax=Tagetes erecta TaxID=13708 RepID=A0AAD8P8N9_TARER|nr:hypothetical protein QVD17_02239 [Tagetes erecta]